MLLLHPLILLPQRIDGADDGGTTAAMATTTKMSDDSSYNEDDDELEHFRIIRTPHSEAYDTVDVSVLNRQRVLQYMSECSISSSTSPTSPFSQLERLINRNGVCSGVVDTLDPSASALRATAGLAFDPPRIGADSGASKSSSSGGSAGGRRKSVGGNGNKSKRKAASDPSKHVFSSVPPESLCMLLPFWPGDTDPPSHRGTHDYPPTRKMHIPVSLAAAASSLSETTSTSVLEAQKHGSRLLSELRWNALKEEYFAWGEPS
ncbi:hypothetical protein BDP27DRAFT_1413482 [Rhodocollybia butyracea]|uniref:Uncharacterized protein n=1 Tax=Rhodocollybia butyracea TaxID=206335 RepID=A0A9P5UFZ5_9AGAR|nr:hypothetical protein BDP27DRAFT_1413482 [Rhodocollybia butyracea]